MYDCKYVSGVIFGGDLSVMRHGLILEKQNGNFYTLSGLFGHKFSFGAFEGRWKKFKYKVSHDLVALKRHYKVKI